MTAPKRIRRTPEEARRVILDAAEASLARGGPAGIRLQEVAKAAGVSHPTILHHFASREGLILALNRRTVDALRGVLLQAIETAASGGGDAVGPTFAAYRNGLAQRIVWMLQAETEPTGSGLMVFDEMVDALHTLRTAIASPGVEVDRADSQAIVHLATLTAFADALIGPRLRQSPTEEEEAAARQRFEIWFSALLRTYVVGLAQAGSS